MSILDQIKDHPWRALVGLALLVAGIAFFVDWLVITDEEQIEIMLLDARDRFLAGDEPGVMASFSRNYSAADISQEIIRAEVKRKRWRDATVSLSSIVFDAKEPDHKASGRVSASGTPIEGTTETRMLWLRFEKIGDDWKIQSVNFQPVR